MAIHEVMEQQTVTIAKAGIHASLNARSSVLAAANPIYGQYDKSRRPQENIGLPDSLLSRFDLLFIVLDQLDSTLDRTLSEHVIKSHQYRRPGTIMEPEALNIASSLNLDEVLDTGVARDTPVWQRGGSSGGSNGASAESNNNTSSSNGDLLTKEFLRKYIHYAKNRVHPVLSDEAMDSISTSYANMRARQSKRNLPVTARTLETMIRLSSAAAKCRLSSDVEEQDVDTAMDLLNFVMFHEVGEAEAAPAPAMQLLSQQGISARPFLDTNNENQPTRNASSQQNGGTQTQPQFVDHSNSAASTAASAGAAEDAYALVRHALESCMEELGDDAIPLTEVMNRLQASSRSSSSSAPDKKQVVSVLREMELKNEVRIHHIHDFIRLRKNDTHFFSPFCNTVILSFAGHVPRRYHSHRLSSCNTLGRSL